MNNIKEEAKRFWNKNKSKIIFGAKCLGVGFGIGFVKGIITESKYGNNGLLYTMSEKLDRIYDYIPYLSTKDFLRGIKDDDLLLNELRNRTYDGILISEEDVGKDVIEIMKDILDNHWRAYGYEC